MDTKYKTIGGILVALIIATSGTVYLTKTGDYVNCRAEWIENDDGTYTCPKNDRTEYCYEIEYRGSGWYRCWLGGRIDIQDDNKVEVKVVYRTKEVKRYETLSANIPCNNSELGCHECKVTGICRDGLYCINSSLCTTIPCDGINFKSKLCKESKERINVGYDIITTNEIIGYEFKGELHKNVIVKEDVLYEWNVPIGDRNMEEYGYCLPAEIKRGVCREVEV